MYNMVDDSTKFMIFAVIALFIISCLYKPETQRETYTDRRKERIAKFEVDRMSKMKSRLKRKNGRQDRIAFLEELLIMHTLIRAGEYVEVMYNLAGQAYQYASSTHFAVIWTTHYREIIDNTSDSIPELRAKYEQLQQLEIDLEDEPLSVIRSVILNKLEDTLNNRELEEKVTIDPIIGKPEFEEKEQSYRDMAIQSLKEMSELGIQPLKDLYVPYFSPLLDNIDDLAACLSEKASVDDFYQCYNEVGVNSMLSTIQDIGASLMPSEDGSEPPAFPLLPESVNSNEEMINALFQVPADYRDDQLT
jgi:hypothetical protein